jgi:hypothetical protein
MTEIQKLQHELEQMRQQMDAKDAQLEKAHGALEDVHAELAQANEENINLQHALTAFEDRQEHLSIVLPDVTEADLLRAQSEVSKLLALVRHWFPIALSAAERRRLQGARQRRYGFIDETKDVLAQNPEFIPNYFTEEDFNNLIRRFEIARNSVIGVEQIQRIIADAQLVLGDGAYQFSLAYYGNVRENSRRRVPTAMQIFERMRTFFRSMGHPKRGENITEAEVERDIHALMHGRKDGKVTIEAHVDKIAKGSKTITDETYKAKDTWKETETGEIEN